MPELRINTNVVKRLRSGGFYPDTMLTSFLTMLCLRTGETELLDAMDDGSTSKRMLVIYYDLLRKGFLDEDTSDESRVLFKLSKRGEEFVNELLDLVPVQVKVEDVDTWIDEWVELFPEGVVSGTKLVRSDRKSCAIKMKKFIKDYGFDKDTIMRATREYLDQFDNQRDGPSYMKCAVYFIDKRGDGSELAGWCERVQKQPSTMSESFVHENNGLI